MKESFVRVPWLLLLACPTVSGYGVSRRHVFLGSIPAAAAATAAVAVAPALAAPTEADLINELISAKSKLVDLPKMVGDQQWDPVRSELRRPAVAALWNVKENASTLRKLAAPTPPPPWPSPRL